MVWFLGFVVRLNFAQNRLSKVSREYRESNESNLVFGHNMSYMIYTGRGAKINVFLSFIEPQ